MHKGIRLLIAPAALLVSMVAVSGCNTVEGMGQDIAALGRTLTGTAQDVAESGEQNQQQQAESGEQQRAAADRD
jgi:predicted small secreted protein